MTTQWRKRTAYCPLPARGFLSHPLIQNRLVVLLSSLSSLFVYDTINTWTHSICRIDKTTRMMSCIYMYLLAYISVTEHTDWISPKEGACYTDEDSPANPSEKRKRWCKHTLILNSRLLYSTVLLLRTSSVDCAPLQLDISPTILQVIAHRATIWMSTVRMWWCLDMLVNASPYIFMSGFIRLL